jgi:hypothetical protein
MPRKVKVLDASGSVDVVVERDVARDMYAGGGWQWWDAGRALRPVPAQRESERSAPALGLKDAEALAGATPMSSRRRERLIGWASSPRLRAATTKRNG